MGLGTRRTLRALSIAMTLPGVNPDSRYLQSYADINTLTDTMFCVSRNADLNL